MTISEFLISAQISSPILPCSWWPCSLFFWGNGNNQKSSSPKLLLPSIHISTNTCCLPSCSLGWNICASSKTLYFLQVSLLVKACPFVHSRNLLQQFSALFCDASVSHLQVIILAGALVCSYFSIIKALPWHLSLFHSCFQCPCACSFRPTGSWMYCLCSTCSFNLCFIWSVLLYFLVSFFSFF